MTKKTRRKILFSVCAGLILILGIIIGSFLLPKTTETKIKVYYVKNDKLVYVEKQFPLTETMLTMAIRDVLTDPRSATPKGTKLLSAKSKANVAFLDFNSKLEQYGGGANRLGTMIAQIVYTATSVPGIDKVQLLINGKKELVLGGEGLIIDKPLSRADFQK